jgi:curli production assembly/transport component CsgG
MKIVNRALCGASLVTLALLASGCASEQKFETSAPTEYQGRIVSGKSLVEQLKDNSHLANPAAVFMVGSCSDETGKFLDNDQLRYSRAVTQAGPDIVVNYLKAAGFRVAERDPRNLSLIGQEYKMSYDWMKSADPKAGLINNGLIQSSRPAGGLVGAKYLVTCAISSYDSSVITGGGGGALDGAGISAQSSTATVGVTMRIVDVSSGLVLSSINLTSTVTGQSFDFHITRFIGDVVNAAATVAGGTATSTVLTPSSNAHVISGELGGAVQAPLGAAVTDAFIVSLMRLLEVGQKDYYIGAVRYTYQDAPTD